MIVYFFSRSREGATIVQKGTLNSLISITTVGVDARRVRQGGAPDVE